MRIQLNEGYEQKPNHSLDLLIKLTIFSSQDSTTINQKREIKQVILRVIENNKFRRSRTKHDKIFGLVIVGKLKSR